MIGYVRKYYVKTVSILLALLFIYAAASKLLDFENFQVQLAQSPLLSAYAEIISYAILFIEFATSFLLLIPKLNRWGLYMSLALMSAFTIYIYLILNFSEFIPCSCGGILEKMGWGGHLVFNIFFVLLTIVAIVISECFHASYNSRPVVYCCLVIAVSCLAVFFLFRSSEYIIKKENNFTRRFFLNPIIRETKFDLGLNSYYFAGSANGKIYLGNSTAPLLLTEIDTALQDTSIMRIRLDHADHPFRNLQLRVKDSSYYLFDGSVSVIYRGRLGNPLTKTVSNGEAYFTQLSIIDTTKFAILTQLRTNNRMTLASLDLMREPKLKLHDLLEKQIDGIFDSSGRLIGGSHSSKLIYTYSYRNQFLVMDNDLNLLGRFNTIDTTTRAKISTVRLSDGSHKMNAPPLSVNHLSTADRNYLFNESMLKGKIENNAAWKKSSIVDIYRLDRPEYVGSFYINKIGKISMSGILADGKYVYVLIGNHIVRNQFRNMLLQ